MRNALFRVGVLLALSMQARAGDWPAWRGPEGNGTTSETALPTKWSKKENVLWSAPLPGPGNSTPVVSGDRVFVTCAAQKGKVRSLLCFGRRDGKLLWKQDTHFDTPEPTHETNPYCSASPATDGRRVFVWHGSAGFFAYDVDGKELWRRDLGPVHHIWGNASSPVLYHDTVILNCGPGPATRLLAMNAATGETVWQNDLPEAKGKAPDEWKGSWSTPLLHESTLILGVPQFVAGFDAASGKELWRCRGLGDLVYNNPMVGNGVVVQMSGFGGPATGLRLPKAGETGDLTESHRLWRVEKNPQRIGSGVVLGEHAYIVNEPGVAECIELKTGKQLWRGRVAGSTWGSSLLSGERIYATDQSGQTVIFRASPSALDVLHRNDLEEPTRASPVPSNGKLFLRTDKALYCIRNDGSGDAL